MEPTNNVEGSVKSAPIAQNSAKAQKLLAKQAKAKGTATAPKPEVKKVKKVRAESNVHIGERLYAEKASAEKVLATFIKVYKEKKGITDKKFIKARADIYLSIAAKRAEPKKEVKKTKKAA